MEMKEIIEKVNYYANLAKTRNLTEEEQADRQHYRELYLENFRKNFRSQLDTIEVVDEDETKAVA